ncbi:MAG: YihY/virulence factor BrkB family protein [Acidimicrobiales bacterium]|nr:YihY/virulence factor BrkB family protein [Acidimicrobiales bacterium]
MSSSREVVQAVSADWKQHRLASDAAGVAFWASLALVPALIALGAALSWTDELVGRNLASSARDGLTALFERALGAESSGVVQTVDQLFDEPHGRAFVLALAVALWSTARAFAAVTRALEVVDQRDAGPWVANRLAGLGLATGTILVAVLGLAVVVLGPFLGLSTPADGPVDELWRWLREPMVGVLLVCWTATVYWLAGHRERPWPGGGHRAA